MEKIVTICLALAGLTFLAVANSLGHQDVSGGALMLVVLLGLAGFATLCAGAFGGHGAAAPGAAGAHVLAHARGHKALWTSAICGFVMMCLMIYWLYDGRLSGKFMVVLIIGIIAGVAFGSLVYWVLTSPRDVAPAIRHGLLFTWRHLPVVMGVAVWALLYFYFGWNGWASVIAGLVIGFGLSYLVVPTMGLLALAALAFAAFHFFGWLRHAIA